MSNISKICPDMVEEVVAGATIGTPSQFAYCFLLYGENQYFLDAMMAAYSLKKAGSPHDRVLLCTPDVPSRLKRQLRKVYTRIFVVENLEVDSGFFRGPSRWHGVFNKLYAWMLDDYEKVVFMDTDMIVRSPQSEDVVCAMDELFAVPAPAAMFYSRMADHGVRASDHLIDFALHEGVSAMSAGLMVIKPSEAVFDDMIQQLQRGPSCYLQPHRGGTSHKVAMFPEEGFLGNYFRGRWRCLSARFQFVPAWYMGRINHGKYSELLESIRGEVGIAAFHFVGYKPWIYLREPSWLNSDYPNSSESEESPLDRRSRKARGYIVEWLDMFAAMEAELSDSRGLMRDLCSWEKISFKNVTH